MTATCLDVFAVPEWKQCSMGGWIAAGIILKHREKNNQEEKKFKKLKIQ
jgi:hypothetical protein